MSFSKSKYVKVFSLNIFTFLFSLFSLSDCRSFPMRDGKILFRFLGLLSACLGLFEILRGAPLPALELPDSITTRRLPRVLGYGLLYKRFFTCYQWMMTNLLQIQGVIYSSQAGSTLVKVIVTLATIHTCNEFCDVLKYSSLLVSQTFVFPFWQIFHFCV